MPMELPCPIIDLVDQPAENKGSLRQLSIVGRCAGALP
jgi:hypothetical protein